MTRDLLLGALVRLRAAEPRDSSLLHAWFNDSEVTRFIASRYPRPSSKSREAVDASATSYSRAGFTVQRATDGVPIGWVELRDASSEDRTAEVDIAVGDKTCWGMGYGTDTMRTACRFGFEVMNLERIQLEVFLENKPAVRSYEKVGFRHEVTARDAQFRFGRYWDIAVMGLLRGELT